MPRSRRSTSTRHWAAACGWLKTGCYSRRRSSHPGTPRTAMDELDRNLERQMRSQERQLMAVRLTLAALAAVVLVAFRASLPSAPVLLALVGVVVAYSLALWWLSSRFPTREVAIVGTALDMAAVTVAVYVQPGAIDAYLFYGLVVLGAALRFGLAASVWSSLVCSGLYATVVLLGADAAGAARALLPVRLVYLVGIGLAAGLYARVVIGRAMEVAQLRTRLEQEERERRREHEEAILSQLAHDFGTNLDRDATVAAIVHGTGSLMGDLAALWLVESDQATMSLADVVGRDEEL